MYIRKNLEAFSIIATIENCKLELRASSVNVQEHLNILFDY